MSKTVLQSAAVAVVAVILLANIDATRGLVSGGNRFFK